MKKTLKSLTVFLLLFTFLSARTPIHPPFSSNAGFGIELCSDDDENGYEIISLE